MSIPEALQTRPMPSVDTMTIDTSILEPLVINDTFCRFVLERKGILDSGSTIQLSVLAGVPDTAVLPLHTGIHALIKRAVLRIGTKVVAITDSYGAYATMHRSVKTPEEKSQKDMVTAGTLDVICPSVNQNGQYQLRDVKGVQLGLDEPLQQTVLSNVAGQSPLFTIKLSQLFPMMRNIQLPLYLIDEPCSVELHFNTQKGTVGEQGKIAVFLDTAMAANVKTAVVDQTSVRLLCDYLTYSDDRMNQSASMAMSEEGMVIPYEDVVTTNTNFTGQNNLIIPTAKTEIRDIGISGMKCRAILGHMRPNYVDWSAQLLGHYESKAYQIPLRYQIRVNDKEVYQRPQDNESKKANEFSAAMNAPISVGSGEYSLDTLVNKEDPNRVINNNYFDGTIGAGANPGAGPLEYTSLEGGSNYMGVDFSSPGNYGVNISQKPVQITSTTTNTAQDGTGRTVAYYSMVERQMSIKNRVVMVSA